MLILNFKKRLFENKSKSRFEFYVFYYSFDKKMFNFEVQIECMFLA